MLFVILVIDILIKPTILGLIAFKKMLDSSCYPTMDYQSAFISVGFALEKLLTLFYIASPSMSFIISNSQLYPVSTGINAILI